MPGGGYTGLKKEPGNEGIARLAAKRPALFKMNFLLCNILYD